MWDVHFGRCSGTVPVKLSAYSQDAGRPGKQSPCLRKPLGNRMTCRDPSLPGTKQFSYTSAVVVKTPEAHAGSPGIIA